MSVCVCVCVCVCGGGWVRACVEGACVRACVHACELERARVVWFALLLLLSSDFMSLYGNTYPVYNNTAVLHKRFAMS